MVAQLDSSKAWEAFHEAEDAVRVLSEQFPDTDTDLAKTHLRNAENGLTGKHYSAAIRNSQRVLEAIRSQLLVEVTVMEESYPGLMELEVKRLKNVIGDGLHGSRDLMLFKQRLESCREKMQRHHRTPRSEKNIPQRGRPRKKKR